MLGVGTKNDQAASGYLIVYWFSHGALAGQVLDSELVGATGFEPAAS